ncbi:MAG: hypothetical protein SFY69_11895 [Planctomycetota bacterium]|nr:hypothetical protein [Planctomycetota bacterium]
MSDLRPAPGFRQRLGYYLVGLSIGCAMLGMIWWIKAQVRQNPAPPGPPPAHQTSSTPPPPGAASPGPTPAGTAP